MGELFSRYFELLSGRFPGAEYGVIATPADEAESFVREVGIVPMECLCPCSCC